jgi:hypothetical protein
MFVADGRVQVIKSMGTVEDHLKQYSKVKGIPHVLHQRFATHGEKTVAMCHPFRVTSKDQHGHDIWVSHNGVLSIQTPRKNKSDTFHLVKDLLRPLLMKDSSLLYTTQFQQLLAKAIGSTNKLAFLDSEGKVILINGSEGQYKGDFWFSNTYSLSGVERHSNPSNVGHFHREWPSYDQWDQGAGLGYWRGNRFFPQPTLIPPTLSPVNLPKAIPMVPFDINTVKASALEDDEVAADFEVTLATLSLGQIEDLIIQNPEAVARFVSQKHGAP